ncbi:conserved hypothetical protein [Neospora caninum Liverpool]|uniref:SANT domain-containing protein n=1 Tax=Neospora caninum (strain Liverpool) TaxID=572307 RepID=F0VKU8_NEOCL|nr:conserved hypothetical protein [Neospora caninum Liverpool]CBZ54699.1 conserved hypothetical protein [Neospora caninum Liverpool]CEL69415.1 TPA: hypothetical protein BN1204_051260 [Neospora caninum Liverpool]|eukprot:XP_003884729.1 conserved hypothetical protein [Neospora caninum Liverpool]
MPHGTEIPMETPTATGSKTRTVPPEKMASAPRSATTPASGASSAVSSLDSSLHETSPSRISTAHSRSRHFSVQISPLSEASPDKDRQGDGRSVLPRTLGETPLEAESDSSGETLEPKDEERRNTRKPRRGSATGEAVLDEISSSLCEDAVSPQHVSADAESGSASPAGSKRGRGNPALSEATETPESRQQEGACGNMDMEGKDGTTSPETLQSDSPSAAATPNQMSGGSVSEGGKTRDAQADLTVSEKAMTPNRFRSPSPGPPAHGDAGGSSVHAANSGRSSPRHGPGSAKQEGGVAVKMENEVQEDEASCSLSSDTRPVSPSLHSAAASACSSPLMGYQARARRACRRPEASPPTLSPSGGSSREPSSPGEADLVSQSYVGSASAPPDGEKPKVARPIAAGDKPGEPGRPGVAKGGRSVEAGKEKRANGVSSGSLEGSPAADSPAGENGVSKGEPAADTHKKAVCDGDDGDGSKGPVLAENLSLSAEGVRGKVADHVNGVADGLLPNAKRRRHGSRNARQSPSATSTSPSSAHLGATKAEAACSHTSAPASERLAWPPEASAANPAEKEQEDGRPQATTNRDASAAHTDGVSTGVAPAAASVAGGPSGPPSVSSLSAGSRPTREGAATAVYSGSGMSTRKRRAQSAAAAAGAAAGETCEGSSPGGEKGGGSAVRDGADPTSPGQVCVDAKASSKKVSGHVAGGSAEKGSAGVGGVAASSSLGGTGWSSGDPTASLGAISDPGAAARFSARLRQRPGDTRAALAARAYHVLPVPSPYVNNKVRCCCCGSGVGSSTVLLGGSGLGPEEPSLAAHGAGTFAGGAGPEGPAVGDPSASSSQAVPPDGVLILPRRISASAYNNLEIRARYDICQRRIRKVEAWLQMIEEWYFGAAAPRWQSLHQQTVQQELVAAVNSTKRSRRIEAVRGGGDASAGLVEAPAPMSPPPWAGSGSSGTGKGSTDCGKFGSGGTSGGSSSGIYGIYSDGGGALGASGGASGAGSLSSRGSTSNNSADSGNVGVVREGRVNPEGGLSTTDSVIYALIVSNNVGRSTAAGVFGGTHGMGGGGGTGGDSGRGDSRDSGASSATGTTGGGGRKGDGGSSHAAKNATGGGKGSRGGGGGAAAAPRLGAVKLTPLELLTSPLRKDNVIDLWGPKEVALFEAGICKYGKDFSALQRLIQTKTTCEIVDFYYLWKQTNRYLAWKQHRHLSKTILHSVFG